MVLANHNRVVASLIHQVVVVVVVVVLVVLVAKHKTQCYAEDKH